MSVADSFRYATAFWSMLHCTLRSVGNAVLHIAATADLAQCDDTTVGCEAMQNKQRNTYNDQSDLQTKTHRELGA